MSLGCSDFLSVDTPAGRLSNNVWNKQAAGTFPWSQCLERRVSGSSQQYGWSWHWPNPGTAIYAYPGIIVGAKPWEPGPGNDPRFPRRVSDTNRLLVSYDVEMAATGSNNLAASIWLIRSAAVATPPNLSAIATEIMIWTESTPTSFVPGGTKRGEVTIDGTAWEVWAAEDWGDQSGANAMRWTYVAYRAKSPTRTISYDAKKMIADAVTRGLVTPDLYIADVELGNEIISGSGKTWLKSFSVVID